MGQIQRVHQSERGEIDFRGHTYSVVSAARHFTPARACWIAKGFQLAIVPLKTVALHRVSVRCTQAPNDPV
jgi:hypothetical protein